MQADAHFCTLKNHRCLCLTRKSDDAFCSWLLISSINSLPSMHPTPLHPSPPRSHRPALNGRHDYVATRCYGNHLLGNEPRCRRAGTTLWQIWEDKSITKRGGYSPGSPKHTWKRSTLLSHNLKAFPRMQTHPKDLESSLYRCYG